MLAGGRQVRRRTRPTGGGAASDHQLFCLAQSFDRCYSQLSWDRRPPQPPDRGPFHADGWTNGPRVRGARRRRRPSRSGPATPTPRAGPAVLDNSPGPAHCARAAPAAQPHTADRDWRTTRSCVWCARVDQQGKGTEGALGRARAGVRRGGPGLPLAETPTYLAAGAARRRCRWGRGGRAGPTKPRACVAPAWKGSQRGSPRPRGLVQRGGGHAPPLLTAATPGGCVQRLLGGGGWRGRRAPRVGTARQAVARRRVSKPLSVAAPCAQLSSQHAVRVVARARPRSLSVPIPHAPPPP